MKNRIYLLVCILVLMLSPSCSKYQKILKSSDYTLKFEKAKEYYEEENYAKALPLLEELMTVYRGTDKGELVYFYFAKSYFGEEDYILSSYHLKNFVRTYPTSEHAEECLYLCALSYYLDSPKYSLDQNNTYLAIQEFQLFINQFPLSTKVEECNQYIDKLRFKLETKSFEAAKLYFHMEQYKSALVAFTNTLKDFPNTIYKEEILFLILRSNYLLASNSIESKKLERFQKAYTAWQKYVDTYPAGKFVKEAQIIGEKSKKMSDSLTKNS